MMRPSSSPKREGVGLAIRIAVLALVIGGVVRADDLGSSEPREPHVHRRPTVANVGPAGPTSDVVAVVSEKLRQGVRNVVRWYSRTPPADRVTWGGIIACAGLGLGVLAERLVRLRSGKIVPAEFTARFLDRLHEGKLDCGKALDHCELNPSPAARVALAAVRRWDRPPADQERAVGMAHRVESERLRRNVGTLRRIAVMAPLLGLLGTLFAIGRALERVPPAPASDAQAAPALVSRALDPPPASWGPLVAAALTPLCAGIIVATLALIAYDGLLTRVEKLAGALDRLGAETIDAIALLAPVSKPLATVAAVGRAARTPHQPPARPSEYDELPTRSRPADEGF